MPRRDSTAHVRQTELPEAAWEKPLGRLPHKREVKARFSPGCCQADMRELDAHQQLLVRNDEKRKDGTVHVTFENRLRARRVARLSCFSCPRS